MSESERLLEQECRILTSFLVGATPTPYVVSAYLDAHAKVGALTSRSRFDQLLVRIARTHCALTRIVDAYARILAPKSLIRNKLVLLLAILETTAPFCRLIDEPGAERAVHTFGKLVVQCVMWSIALVVGIACLLPLQICLGRSKDSSD